MKLIQGLNLTKCSVGCGQIVRKLATKVTLECDYVVVGAGSAGSVVASRLAADNKHKVVVLEAGCKDNTWKISMPAALMYCLKSPRYSWCYQTEPQKHANNRVMFHPRGKVWGGSSSINAMVYIRGHPLDYDRWESEGAVGWSYADCLPYFRRAQEHQLGGDLYRGGQGPLYVSRGLMDNPLYGCFMQAGKQAGYGLTDDVNGFRQEGFGHFDMTIKQGRRCSTSAAYLRRSIAEKKDLTVVSNSHVTRVLMQGNRAVGVEYKKGRQLKQVMARKEVILCGGAINSPQLLMLSGIGDSHHLKQLSIPLNHHLPGVGSNLQDHLEIFLQYSCSQPVTLYKYQWKFPVTMAMAGVEWFVRKTGAAASTHLEAGAFIRSHQSMQHPDIQLHFLPSIVIDHGQKMGNCHAFQAHAGTMRATSVGSLKLKSKSPFEHPSIDFNYLSTHQDVLDLRNTVKLTKEILEQKAFEKYKAGFYDKNLKLDTDDEIDEFVRNTSETAYHPCGTAKMGSEKDKSAVVDSECRVMGVDNLRVVDASVIPSIVSGNLNAPVIMMAEKVSDLILHKAPLPKESPPVWKPSMPSLQREG